MWHGCFLQIPRNRRRSALRGGSRPSNCANWPVSRNSRSRRHRYRRTGDIVQKLNYLGGPRDAKVFVMKGYGSFCPVAKAAEILTERWTPLVLRELLLGSCHFSQLRRGIPQMSPTQIG